MLAYQVRHELKMILETFVGIYLSQNWDFSQCDAPRGLHAVVVH